MSIALCLRCGADKVGALAPCGQCGAPPIGEPAGLDLSFSDRSFDQATLRGFGEVIRRINAQHADPALRFWIFIRYISERVPGILEAEAPDGLKGRVSEALAALDLPVVVARRPVVRGGIGWMGWMVRIGLILLIISYVMVMWLAD